MAERIIGIDFGTSTSVIKVKRYNNGVPVSDRTTVMPVKFGNENHEVVPSLIQRTEKGSYYGYDAQILRPGAQLIQNFKIKLESDDEQEKNAAREYTREFFSYLAKVYSNQCEHLGEPGDTEKTIISYPVKWSEETRSFMKQAATDAGFVNVQGMDEAQAAINAVLVQKLDYIKEKGYLKDSSVIKILLIDMGAGTTDLVLCEYDTENQKTQVLCTWPEKGNTFFGGNEIDEILVEYIKKTLPEDIAEAVISKCSIDKFKTWKEQYVSATLKSDEAVTSFSDIDMITQLLNIIPKSFCLDRNEFERIAEEYLSEFPELVNGCIKNAGISSEEIDLVITTGGHSQWYFVRELLSGRIMKFGNADLPKINYDNERIIPVALPQETVALGLVFSPLVPKLKVEPSGFEFSSHNLKPSIYTVDDITSNADTFGVTADLPEICGIAAGKGFILLDNDLHIDSIYRIMGNVTTAQSRKPGYRKYSFTIQKKKSFFKKDDNAVCKGSKFRIATLNEKAKMVEERFDNYTVFYFDKTTCGITKYHGNADSVIIPEYISDCLVTNICMSAFESQPIKKVVIPQGVKTINAYAFKNCKNLQTVIASKNIESINGEAFRFCTSLQTVDFKMGAPVPGEIHFPNGLKYIGSYAFEKERGKGLVFKKPGPCIFKKVHICRTTDYKDAFGGSEINLYI